MFLSRMTLYNISCPLILLNQRMIVFLIYNTDAVIGKSDENNNKG